MSMEREAANGLLKESMRSSKTDSLVRVREYNEEQDRERVEEMESRCEVGEQQQGGGRPCLVTHLLGDPLGRVRQCPIHVMLVAEYGEERKLVGVIRGSIKTVTTSKKKLIGADYLPVYEKLAYILGLRVDPPHRRYGIGTKLVSNLEEWCRKNEAKYVYMATECTNEASIALFTRRCHFIKFRTPTVLVQPVQAHYLPINSSHIVIVQLAPPLAGSHYRRIFENSEFFPSDIDYVLTNKLNLGTFIALPRKCLPKWDFQKGLPPSFALLSVWNTKAVYQLQLKGVSKLAKACCLGSRVLDAHMPWLRLPSVPNFFRPFGYYFLFGLHMEGKSSRQLMKSLCNFVHNMARDDVECGAIVAEVARRDPVIEGIPHWKRFSWDEDLWCIKELGYKKHEYDREEGCQEATRLVDDHWTTLWSSSSVIFVDPRDI